MNVISQVLVLFFLILIGYGAKKLRAIDDAAVNHLSSFVLNITLPALIVASLQRPFTRELLSQAGATLAIAFAVYGFSFAVAALYPALIRPDRKERGVHRYALVFSNVGFMGYPVVEAILGRDALFNLAIYNIPFNFLAFSVGAWLLAKEGNRPVSLSWKAFVNPAMVATLVGFLFFVFSIKLPAPVFQTLKMTGDVTSPVSMIAIGAVLARMDPRRVFGRWRTYATTVMRLAILPALVALILWNLGFRGILYALPVITTAMPVAANTTILANVYEADVETSSALVFISTLVCVATIPLIATMVAV